MNRKTFLDPYGFIRTSGGGIVKCETIWSWKPAPLIDYDLWYVKSGNGVIWINNKRYVIEPSSLFILCPGDIIQATHDPKRPLTVIYCHFEVEANRNEPAIKDIVMQENNVRIKDIYRMEPLLLQLIDSAIGDKQTDDEFNLLMKLIFTRWEKERTRTTGTRSDYYYEHIIHRIYHEINMNLSVNNDYNQLAAAVDLTPRYLSAIMKRYSGLSLKETITKLRMERAQHLLQETTMSITDIAEALGYMDVYTFSKIFKRYYEIAPSYARAKLHLHD